MKRYPFILFILSMMTLMLSTCGKGPLPPADSTPPAISFLNPANGATNVPLNSTIIITFNEAMDPSSISGQTITLWIGNSNVQGSVTYSNNTAVFTPAASLSPTTTYTVSISGTVRDAAGNAMGNPYAYTFRTGIDTQLDIIPPRVVDIHPSRRLTGVRTNTSIMVLFSESMDPTTIIPANVVISTANDVPINCTVTSFGSAAISRPTSSLAPNSDYRVLITTRVKDSTGNAMTEAFLSRFRTGPAQDTTAPTVVPASVVPASGGISVSINTPIKITFSEPMNVSTFTESNFIVSDGTATIPGSIQYYGTTVVFTPSSPLDPAIPYTVTVKNLVTDLANRNMSSDYSWSFTTEAEAPDSVPPQVLATYPASGDNGVPIYRNVVVLFNEAMLGSSFTPMTFVLIDSSGPGTAIPGSISSTGALVSFTPTQPLEYDKTYTAIITGAVTDLAGNQLIATSWSFTTETVPAFIITPSAGPNGTISPSTSQIVSYGSTTTFTITAAAGYQISDVLVDGGSIGVVSNLTSTTYTFTDIAADHTINATFAINTYTITASAGANGSVSPSGPVTVNHGMNQAFTFTPDTGYHVDDVLVDNVTIGAVSSYTFTSVTGNHTISATFAINTYTINFAAGANGTVSGTTSQTVNHGGSTTAITASPTTPNYHFVNWTGTGGFVTTTANPLIVSNVTATQTITANFAIDTYGLTVTKSGTGNVTADTGTLTWNGNTGTGSYDYGTPVVLTALPDASSTFTSWAGCDSVSGTQCTVSMNAVKSVTATFAIKTFTITASADTGGSINPAGSVTVNYGATPTFTFTANAGYFVSSVLVNGVDQGILSSYTFTAVTGPGPYTIEVKFLLGSNTIRATAGTGGTITSGGVVVASGTYQDFLVSYNGSREFTTAPNAGHHIDDVLADGVTIYPVSHPATYSYTFTGVTGNHTISATFAVNTTSINLTSSLNPSTYGASVTFTATVTSAYGTPTGTVTFSDGGTLLGTGTLSGGIATLSISSLTGGTHTITAVYNGDSNFAGSTSLPLTQTVNQASQTTLTVVATPSTVAYNSTSALSTLGGSGTGAVTFSSGASTGCSVAGSTLSVTDAGGTCSITATKAADTNYTAITSAALPVDLAKANPTVTAWPTATAITFGQTLADSTLAGGSSTPAGTFAFTTPATAPNAGTASQSVTFTPNDTTNYNTVAGSVNVTVNKANPTVTAWPTATAITFGQALADSTLTGGSASTTGAFAFTTPATAPDAGTASQSVTFMPNDTNNYNTVAGSVNVTVDKATPTINWSNPTDITYGTALSGTQLNATTSVPGTFAYSPVSGTVLTVGAGQTLSVTFTPTDTGNYNTATASVQINVNKANPTVTAWPTASAIIYGQTLADSTLTGGSASTTGGFAFTTPTTVPDAGTAPQSVTFTPNDTTNYTTVTGAVSVTVDKATATVTLSNLSQTYDGTPKAAAAATNPAGLTVTFTYDGNGTAPTNAGSYAVVGTINDTNYQGSGSGTLVIGKATATVTLSNLNQTYDGTPKTASATTGPAGLIVDFTYDGSAVPPTNVGSYAVIGTINSINYEGTAGDTLVINKATPTVTAWPTASAITSGQTLADSTLTGGSASTTGTFDFTNPTTMPDVGTAPQSVTFAPYDTANYNSVTGSVSVTVN